MNILLLGSGAREHALAWKIKQSELCSQLFVAPGNAGTSKVAINVDLDPKDFDQLKVFSIENQIDMIVVGPEDPLVLGVYDFVKADQDIAHIKVIGPSKEAAQLEGSKEFAKEFMFRHKIPTAAYQSFDQASIEEGYAFLELLSPPYVLKADGLAAGKGVLIIDKLSEAKEALKQMLIDQKFGHASSKVVIETFLDGIELSCFVLTDGKSYKILPTAKDYKRIGEGDTGLNTGGMGAISPVPFADKTFLEKVEKRIIIPTIEGIKKDQLTYQGFVFIGLIKVGDDPFVIEYNVRMGDPETEVVIPRVNSDLVALFNAVSDQTLGNKSIEIDTRSAATVMLVSGGYPEAYQKNKTISGIDSIDESLVFHAGTKKDGDLVKTNGGRVIAVTSYGETFKDALNKSYQNLEKINFDKIYFRKDIGFDLKE